MIVALVFAAFAVTAASASAAPFADGSFPSPTAPADSFTDYVAPSTAITGWTVTAGSVDLVSTGLWPAADGGQSIDLDGVAAGTLCQTYDANSPGNGAVNFELSHNFGGTTTATVEVMVDGIPVGTFTHNLAASASNMNYQSHTVTFTPSGASTTLCFISQTPGSAGPVISAVALATANLSLTKAAAPTASCTPAQGTQPCVLHGQDVTYTLTESNAGPNTATAPTITDTLPAGQGFVSSDDGCTASGTPVVVTCPTTDLGDGGSDTIHIEASTTGVASLTAPLLQTDNATVGSVTPDPTPGNNATSAGITVVPTADLSLAKSALPVSPPGCSAAQATQAGATQPCVLHGQNVTYALVETNNGPDQATAPTITDTLPAGQTFVSSDDSCTAAGTPVVVTCPTPNLPASSSDTVHIVASTAGIPAPLAAPLVQTDHASVSSTTVDLVPANNATTATITVIPAADLALTKTGSPNPVIANQQLIYTLTASNLGPDTAVSTKITDVLPAGDTFAVEGVVELVRNTITGGAEVVGNAPSAAALAAAAGEAGCTPATSGGVTTVTCTVGNLPAGSSATFTLLVIASSTPGPSANTATVSSNTADPNPINNTSSTTTTISPECTTTDTGTIATGLDVETGTFLCLNNAKVTGVVQVDKGAGLTETNSTTGAVQGESPVFMTVCGSTVNGSIVIHNASELVRVGDDKDTCAPNKVSGSVTLDDNTGGAAGPAIDGNKITGSLDCKTNNPVSSDEGVPNTVGGSKLYECSGAF